MNGVIPFLKPTPQSFFFASVLLRRLPSFFFFLTSNSMFYYCQPVLVRSGTHDPSSRASPVLVHIFPFTVRQLHHISISSLSTYLRVFFQVLGYIRISSHPHFFPFNDDEDGRLRTTIALGRPLWDGWTRCHIATPDLMPFTRHHRTAEPPPPIFRLLRLARRDLPPDYIRTREPLPLWDLRTYALSMARWTPA